MTGFHSATIPADRLLPGIHGLRGIAAVAIVLYHLVKIAGLDVPDALVLAPVLLLLSELTYRMVEVPGMRYASNLMKRQ